MGRDTGSPSFDIFCSTARQNRNVFNFTSFSCIFRFLFSSIFLTNRIIDCTSESGVKIMIRIDKSHQARGNANRELSER